MSYVRIQATSVMGWPIWITKVSEPVEGDDDSKQPIVSAVNREAKAPMFSQAEAEAMLPAVHTVHPEAKIVSAYPAGADPGD